MQLLNIISIAKEGSAKYAMRAKNANKQASKKLNTAERLRDKLFLKQMEKLENTQI